MRSKYISPIRINLRKNEKINFYKNNSIKKSIHSTNYNSPLNKTNSRFRTTSKLSIFNSNTNPISNLLNSPVNKNKNNKSSSSTIYNTRQTNNTSLFQESRISHDLIKVKKIKFSSLKKTNKLNSIDKLSSNIRHKISDNKIHLSSTRLNNFLPPPVKNHNFRAILFDKISPKYCLLFRKKHMNKNLIGYFGKIKNVKEEKDNQKSIENGKPNNKILSSLIKKKENKKNNSICFENIGKNETEYENDYYKYENKELFKIRFKIMKNKYKIFESKEKEKIINTYKDDILYKNISNKSPFLEINNFMTLSHLIKDNEIMTKLLNRNNNKHKQLFFGK